jgi:hypothetical protein
MINEQKITRQEANLRYLRLQKAEQMINAMITNAIGTPAMLFDDKFNPKSND